jgi:hypothetical protein
MASDGIADHGAKLLLKFVWGHDLGHGSNLSLDSVRSQTSKAAGQALDAHQRAAANLAIDRENTDSQTVCHERVPTQV